MKVEMNDLENYFVYVKGRISAALELVARAKPASSFTVP